MNTIVPCTICQRRKVHFPSKAAARKKASSARCEYCKARYDSQGKAFIIASDIYKFYLRGRTIYVWVCDKRVSDIKGTHLGDLNCLIDEYYGFMMDYMKSKGYKLENISHATI